MLTAMIQHGRGIFGFRFSISDNTSSGKADAHAIENWRSEIGNAPLRWGSLLMVLLLVAPWCAAEPLSYGEESNGVEMALEQPSPGLLRVHLRNKGPGDAKLEKGFIWVLLAEARDKAYYTEKLPLDDEKPELAPAQELVREFDLAQTELYPYQKGVKVLQGYPQAPAGVQAVKPAELPATLRAQAFAYLSAGGERATVKSKAMPVFAHSQGLASKTKNPATQPAGMAALVEAFRRDAFSAKDAHDRAVKVGQSALPSLRAALADPTMPDFGQMWIATAIIHINGTDAAKAVVGLVNTASEGVRDVVAYHGPSMKQPSVDQAILGRAQSGEDPLFTAWAGRGFVENGRPFPQELLDAASSSREPRARAEVADALAKRGTPADLKKLSALARDENELVRIAVADAVRKYSLTDPRVVSALAASLNMQGESAQQRVVEALAVIAHQPWQYDPQATEAQRLKTLNEVRAWAAREAK